MANDRMLLRCDVCGECISIARHFQCPWDMYEGDVDRDMDFFFKRHYPCQLLAYRTKKENTDSFIEPQHLYSLVFEAEPGEGLADGVTDHWIQKSELEKLDSPLDLYDTPYTPSIL